MRLKMRIVAQVRIEKSNFHEWKAFFDSYEHERLQFVRDETVKKINDNEAEVSFYVTDFDGLTALSGSDAIIAEEERLGIVTKILS
jgi:hypothetical protein